MGGLAAWSPGLVAAGEGGVVASALSPISVAVGSQLVLAVKAAASRVVEEGGSEDALGRVLWEASLCATTSSEGRTGVSVLRPPAAWEL